MDALADQKQPKDNMDGKAMPEPRFFAELDIHNFKAHCFLN